MPSLIGIRVVLRSIFGRPINPLLEALQADHILRGFDANPHLVAIVGAGQMEAMSGRADGGSENQVRLGDVSEGRMAVEGTADGRLTLGRALRRGHQPAGHDRESSRGSNLGPPPEN